MSKKSNIKSEVFPICFVVMAASALFSCASKKVAEERMQKPQVVVMNEAPAEKSPEKSKTVSPGAQLFPMAHFAFDSAVLNKSDIELIRTQAKEMKNRKNAEMLVVGACDERGSVEYNMKLGLRRAQSVRAKLESFGVSRNQIRIKSIGESSPIADGHDEESWAQNRRAEMHLELKTRMTRLKQMKN